MKSLHPFEFFFIFFFAALKILAFSEKTNKQKSNHAQACIQCLSWHFWCILTPFHGILVLRCRWQIWTPNANSPKHSICDTKQGKIVIYQHRTQECPPCISTQCICSKWTRRNKRCGSCWVYGCLYCKEPFALFHVWRMEIKRLCLQIKGLHLRGRVCSEFNEIHPQNKSYANKFSLMRVEGRGRQNEGESEGCICLTNKYPALCFRERYWHDSKRG